MDIKIEDLARLVFEDRNIEVPNPNYEYCKKDTDGKVLKWLGIDKPLRCSECGLKAQCSQGRMLVMERPIFHLLMQMGELVKEKMEARK